MGSSHASVSGLSKGTFTKGDVVLRELDGVGKRSLFAYLRPALRSLLSRGV